MSKDFKQEHMMKLQGKDYLPVAPRVLMFRKEHPTASIHTETRVIGEDTYVFAQIARDGSLLATAHKKVKKGGKGPAALWPLETAETGAIGRALALCGYGTLAGELDEGDQLADAPVETLKPSEGIGTSPTVGPSLESLLSAVADSTSETFEAQKVEWRDAAKVLNQQDREKLKDAVLNRANELRG